LVSLVALDRTNIPIPKKRMRIEFRLPASSCGLMQQKQAQPATQLSVKSPQKRGRYEQGQATGTTTKL
jgi:hypothetical protein